jgi:D-xylose transport system ATP-binding protein
VAARDATTTPVLALTGIEKRFGAIRALAGVDFEVFNTEVVALVGDNGAGKSTLVKIISGTHIPDAGTIKFEGQRVAIHSPRDAMRRGIDTVYQDLALCDNLDVVQNMFLGRESIVARLPLALADVDMERRALEVLASLEVTTIRNVRTEVARLSGGQRQAVAISRAVMWNSKIVILDEPTAALGVVQTRHVLDLIGRLKTHGIGVVLISHNLQDILEVADRIVVLRLGARVATFARGAAPDDIVAAITGARGHASTP